MVVDIYLSMYLLELETNLHEVFTIEEKTPTIGPSPC